MIEIQRTMHWVCGCAHFIDMLSTPTATPSEISPVSMAFAMLRIACNPEEHNRFTVEMGTSAGTPAANAAALDT